MTPGGRNLGGRFCAWFLKMHGYFWDWDRNPGLFRGFRRPRNFDIGPFGQVTDLECKKISVQVTPAYLNIAELGKIRRIFPIRLRYPLWSQAAPLAQQP